METIFYLAQVNLYWAVFYGCYISLLYNHTFFSLNRFYLVASLLTAFLLPTIELTAHATSPFFESVSAAGLSDPAVPLQNLFEWLEMLIFIYIFGVEYMFFKLLRGFYNLYRLMNQGEKVKFEDYILILLPEAGSGKEEKVSFSFFNLLVVSHADYENNFETILLHEREHIRQKHSLDILLIEVIKVFFWFNPVLWCYKFSMRKVHEFLADRQVGNRDSYAEFLISYAQKASEHILVNHFFSSSLLMERVKMLYKKPTARLQLIKYLLIIPIICMTVSMTADRRQLVKAAESRQSESKAKIEVINLKTQNRRPKPQSGTVYRIKNYSLKHPGGKAITRRQQPSRPVRQNVNESAMATNFRNYNVAPVALKHYDATFPTPESLGASFYKTVDLSGNAQPALEIKPDYNFGVEAAPTLTLKTSIRYKYFKE